MSTETADSAATAIHSPARVHQILTGPPSGTTPAESEPLTRRNATSHHAYAARTVEHLTVKGWKPVFHQGQLFVLNEANAIWEPFDKEDLLRIVAELNDGRRNCMRRTDYTGIADQALSIANNAPFFEKAPVGLACSDSFYRVENSRVVVEPLGAGHRQRVLVDYEPVEACMPHFEGFLSQTFHSDEDGEEAQQRQLVQEIAGAALLGIMPRFQKAVLFYDPYGRAGKGTLERIIGELVPDAFTSAVSPFKWDKEYYLADLIGKRLNVVGELPEGESIPSANFKSVLGGDLISGRQPTKSVVTFRNEAAHIFTSNHLISTRDQSEAFFSRWLLVEFPNSLLRSGLPVDTGLAGRIIAQELPGIAHWALQGGIRLLEQGRFSSSIAHDRLMQKWRRSSNSIDEFIHEECGLGPQLHERRSTFYVAYKVWCQENGRKPYSKTNVKELMEHRVALPVHFSVLDGYEVIRGISVREDYKDKLTSFA
jgi:P4 family phage/plasmid primase-like protien